MNQTADLTEKTLSREEKYQGNILSLHVDQVQLPNGKTSFREVVEHVDGVAILALDDRNNVLTVTQYRYVFGRPLLEIPAGKLEPGEDPAGAEGGDRRCAGHVPAHGCRPALPRLPGRTAASFPRQGTAYGKAASG